MSRSFSLEYAHATYRPLKHRFIKKWVYRLVIAFIHLWKIICRGTIQEITDWKLNLIMVYSSFLFFFFCFHLYLLYFNLYQSSSWSSFSTSWCSRSEGKKTDEDIVSCYLFVIINLSTNSYWRRYGLYSYHCRSKIFLTSVNFLRHTNIILGQLANKSYTLCIAHARI